jgi:hypothetical protein
MRGEPQAVKPVRVRAQPQRLDAADPSVLRLFVAELDLPPQMLSPNVTPGHWAMKRAATRKYRRDCGVIFLRSKPRGWTACAVVIDVTFVCPPGSPGYMPKDVQNAIASLKANIDALTDARVIPDDVAKYLQWGRFDLINTAARAEGRHIGVTITVRRHG